ncbi:MAG: 6-phosphofructokinase, partial [Faecalibacterium sp.]|nr:6-phosphofructokinase [Faecalibacterium sp.]
GFDTAMNTALDMIDKLRDTTQSHDRCSVVEVMGRNAGYIALNVAIASGAVAVLLPEHPFDFQKDILDRIAITQKTGKKHFIVVVAEGVGHAQEIANEIQARTGIDSRATVLGHVQRGGSPTLRDRVSASEMGYHAICLLDQGQYNRIVGLKGDKLVDYHVDEALEMSKHIDPQLIDICNTISI